MFSKIGTTSTKDKALELIRSAILDGRLHPGERITELRLSSEMDVSQGVVREALQDLEFQGLVIRIPKRGTFVTDFGMEDIRQIYEFRMECEGLAVELARKKGRPNEADLADLQQAISQMQMGADSGDFLQFSRNDLRFHEYLWQMSGNHYLEKALRVVATPQFAYVLIRSFRHTRLDLCAIVEQHREIVEKLRTADPEECRKFLSDMTADFLNQIVKGVVEAK
ncbi:MAG: GntR family transcriptional regulator [Terriglobia bacterium]